MFELALAKSSCFQRSSWQIGILRSDRRFRLHENRWWLAVGEWFCWLLERQDGGAKPEDAVHGPPEAAELRW